MMTNEELDKLEDGRYKIRIRWGGDVKEVEAEFKSGMFTNWHTQYAYYPENVLGVVERLPWRDVENLEKDGGGNPWDEFTIP